MKTWITKSGYKLIRIVSGRSNAFLLTNGSTNILIDTSVSFLWGKLQKRLIHLGVDKIDCLIITHPHFDHAANASQIKNKYNPAVIIHKLEAAYLAAGDNIIPSGTNPVTRFIINVIGKRVFTKFKYAPCKCDIVVDDYLDMKQYGFNAWLMHTPGHTPGSMSMIVDDEIALVGDTMFGVFPGSVFPPYALNPGEMVQSWGKLLQTPCSLFLPAHGSGNSRELVEKDYKKRNSNKLKE